MSRAELVETRQRTATSNTTGEKNILEEWTQPPASKGPATPTSVGGKEEQ
jgi:hypothetical protein